VFEYTQLSPNVGAEVRGIDLRKQPDGGILQELETAFLRYKALFFRDQDLTTEQFVAFFGSFGRLWIAPKSSQYTRQGVDPGAEALPPGVNVISCDRDHPPIDGVENNWHVDSQYLPEEVWAAPVLRCLEIPPVGGDTMFVDMSAAYDTLSRPTQQLLESVTAFSDGTRYQGLPMGSEKYMEFMRESLWKEHPVVLRHPVTGAKSIFASVTETRWILGVCEEESRAILHLISELQNNPQFQCRFTWRRDSIAMWDNRLLAHRVVADYWPERRMMQRLTILGSMAEHLSRDVASLPDGVGVANTP
jgi:taurine dioxygenase